MRRIPFDQHLPSGIDLRKLCNELSRPHEKTMLAAILSAYIAWPETPALRHALIGSAKAKIVQMQASPAFELLKSIASNTAGSSIALSPPGT